MVTLATRIGASKKQKYGRNDGQDVGHIEKIKAGGNDGGIHLAAPQHNSSYNPNAFLPLHQAMNFGAIIAPPTRISPRIMMPTQAPHLFLIYASRRTIGNIVNPFAP